MISCQQISYRKRGLHFKVGVTFSYLHPTSTPRLINRRKLCLGLSGWKKVEWGTCYLGLGPGLELLQFLGCGFNGGCCTEELGLSDDGGVLGVHAVWSWRSIADIGLLMPFSFCFALKVNRNNSSAFPFHLPVQLCLPFIILKCSNVSIITIMPQRKLR